MKLLFIFVLGCVAYVNAFPVNNAVSEDDKVYSAELVKIKAGGKSDDISDIPSDDEENVFHDPPTKLIEEGSGDLLSQETEEEMDNKKEESMIQKEKEPDAFDVALTKLMEEESSDTKENKKQWLKNMRFRQKTNAFKKQTSPPT